MKLGGVTLAVVDKDGAVSGDMESATIGYRLRESAERDRVKCDGLWPGQAPHRVVAVRLVEVEEESDG